MNKRITDQLSNENFFPGYIFDDEVSRERSIFLKQTLENMVKELPLTDKMKHYEIGVVKKYIKSGTLTAFKSHVEIKLQQDRTKVKNQMSELEEKVDQYRQNITCLENEIIETRVIFIINLFID
jgi:uncharacterized coiled-coil DUF342 family protein